MAPRHPLLARYLTLLGVLAAVWTVEMGTLLALDRVTPTELFGAYALVGLNVLLFGGFLWAGRIVGRSRQSLDFAMVLLGVHAVLLALFTLQRFTYFLPYNVLVTAHHVPLLALDAFALVALGVRRAGLAQARGRRSGAGWVAPRPSPAYAPMRAQGSWMGRRKRRGAPPVHVALANRRR